MTGHLQLVRSCAENTSCGSTWGALSSPLCFTCQVLAVAFRGGRGWVVLAALLRLIGEVERSAAACFPRPLCGSVLGNVYHMR
jgi:hypothetical protein